MTLTTGATLQSSKYVIQARLHQSDFGATYEATHALLDQPVILQTLNPVVQKRPDFADLRQQFMQAVRSLSRQETAQGTARVLDYFEEEGMPFVVLQQPIAGQTLPKLNDWLTLPPEPLPEKSVGKPKSVAPAALVEQSISSQPQSSAPQFSTPQPSAKLGAGAAAAKGAIGSEVLPVVSAPDIAVPEASPIQASPVQTSPVQTSPAQTSQVTVSVAPSAPKAFKAILSKGLPVLPKLSTSANSTGFKSSELAPKRKLPVGLLITALAGLGLGAGGGLALRYQPAQTNQVDQTSQTSPNAPSSASGFSSNLFSNEQTFPSQSDWPIEEDPTLFPAAPRLEEPVYRSTPVPDYYSAPSTQPLYRNPASQPAAPPPSYSSYDSKPTPELPPDAASPVSPLPKPSDLNVPAPKREAIDFAPAPDASVRQPVRQAAPEPVPEPELSPLVPIAPDLSAPPEISTPPAHAPKGLGTRPLVSQ